MGFYEDLQKDAKGILKDFKQGSIKYVKLTKTGGSFDEPATISRAETTVNAIASSPGEEYVSKGLNTVFDKKVTMPFVSGLTPSMDDWLSIDGTDYKIVYLKPIPAAGTVVVWEIIARKG